MYKLILFVCAVMLASCGGQNNKNAQSITSNSDGEFVVKLANDGSATFKGHLHNINDSQTFIFEATQGQKLSAAIEPAKKPANIRFHQLISPSGKMDGPFDISLETTLNETGKWKLIVGESNMQGDEYHGDYDLVITVK